MKTILFVDDDKVRVDSFCKNIGNDPNLAVCWSKSVEEAKTFLNSFEDKLSLVMLDNDLGDGIDGIELAKWIVDNNIQRDSVYVIHSLNPIANRRIYNTLKSVDYEVHSLPGSWMCFSADGKGNISYAVA